MPLSKAPRLTPVSGQTPPSAPRSPSSGPFMTPWPIPGDIPALNGIITEQAATITDQEALLHAYQGALNAQQVTLPAATGDGTSTGTNQLTVTNVSGTIVTYAEISAPGAPPGTVTPGTAIIGQTSGATGGVGIYTTNVPSSIPGGTALTFTPTPPGPWPVPQDAPTLNLIVQQQTAVLRVQTALIQHYQDLLNTSQTPPPASGP